MCWFVVYKMVWYLLGLCVTSYVIFFNFWQKFFVTYEKLKLVF